MRRGSPGFFPPRRHRVPAPLVKSPLSSLRPLPSSKRTPSRPNLSNLSMARSTPRRRPASASLAGSMPAVSSRPVEHLAIVQLDLEFVRRQTERDDHIRHQHAGFGVRRDVLRADGIGVALHELAEAARPGLLVAPDRPHRIAAIGRRDDLLVLGDIARERRGHVVAQATSTARLRPAAKTRPRSAGPDRAGTCRAPRCIRTPGFPAAHSRSAHRPRGWSRACAWSGAVLRRTMSRKPFGRRASGRNVFFSLDIELTCCAGAPARDDRLIANRRTVRKAAARFRGTCHDAVARRPASTDFPNAGLGRACGSALARSSERGG